MNAIDFLKKEHNKVREMLTLIEDHLDSKETKKEKFNKLSAMLLRHEHMEHEIWYPHFKNDLSDEVQHLIKEEKIAEREINKLQDLYESSNQVWADAFKKFKMAVEHHAEEEEKSLFPEVKHLLSASKLNAIGKAMKNYDDNNPIN